MLIPTEEFYEEFAKRIVPQIADVIKAQLAEQQPAPLVNIDPDQLMTKKEAAELLNISQSTIDNYRKSGVLEAIKIGKAVRFRRKELHAILNHRKKSREQSENRRGTV
jgi:excisionase family DNA binding protein